MEEIEQRLARVREQIAVAARRGGRGVEKIELIAVSKTQPPEAVLRAWGVGQRSFGENRVQEARAKAALLPSGIGWHLIGPLQKNKIRQALGVGFGLLQGIDSLELARELDRIAGEEGLFPEILLQINQAGEASKFGFSPEVIRRQMVELLGFGRLQIQGLMTIPPFAPEAEDSRRYFVELRELRDSLEKEFGVMLPKLSMGMSGDFAVAVEEGATLVRVGTAIFGVRQGKTWKPGGSEADSGE